MSRYSILPLLLTVALIACQSVNSQTSHVASLGAEITLAPADRAVLSQQGIEVQFVAVVEDSRCPRDTTCVWAGEVRVQLAIRSGSAQPTQHEVVEGQSASIDRYRVTVLQVRPEPVSTRKISPEQYRATLKVERS